MKFKTKLIAEIGSNHNRDITRCYKLIDEAKISRICCKISII